MSAEKGIGTFTTPQEALDAVVAQPKLTLTLGESFRHQETGAPPIFVDPFFRRFSRNTREFGSARSGGQSHIRCRIMKNDNRTVRRSFGQFCPDRFFRFRTRRIFLDIAIQFHRIYVCIPFG